MSHDRLLYDEELLQGFKSGLYLPAHFHLRPLKLSDFHLGHLKLLAQLTSVGDVNEEKYQEQFKRMSSSGDYYVTVIEDTSISKLVASATLFLESKFIHNCAIRGRIEDVVVDSTCRGAKLGHALIGTLKELAIKTGCYKLTLDCNDEMVPYYKKFGFLAEYGRANLLTIRL